MASEINASHLESHPFADSLIPGSIPEEFLLWPPDLFAYTSQILSMTGAYHLTVSPPRGEQWPPTDAWAKPTWNKYVRKIGFQWHDNLTANFTVEKLQRCKEGPQRKRYISETIGMLAQERNAYRWRPAKDSWTPAQVGNHWAILCRWMDKEGRKNLEEILCNEDFQKNAQKRSKNWEAFKALITLHAIADEASVGFGIMDLGVLGPDPDPKKILIDYECEEESDLSAYAARQLEKRGTLATITTDRCRVLPKRHTPQVGITLRSLTSNLAYHRSSVDVRWKHTDDRIRNDLITRMRSSHQTFSVLLLPWPLKIRALDFTVAGKASERLKMNEEQYGLFSYMPQEKWFDEDMVREALDAALGETKAIDMVVLPESALSEDERKRFETVIGGRGYWVSSYVAGIRENPIDAGLRKFNDNMVYFNMGKLVDEKGKYSAETDRNDLKVNYEKVKTADIQHKHHRWKLERNQITNYSLGHVLPPHKDWWEAIKIRRRKVTFINIGYALTICPLICEDLARQDPIADLIRTVGPSLVITILMDGPQKKERWSARYASVLSEDPGSAVIALTSFGMVNRWRRPFFEPSRVVALWNDGQGLEREIELEEGSIGILLSLSVDGRHEPCADGRVELFPTNRVTLGGIHQIRSSG